VSSASTLSTLSTMSNISSMSGSSMSSMSGSSVSGSDISLSSMTMDSIDFDQSVSVSKPKGGVVSSGDDDDSDSPVVRYINHLVLEAFRLRASDIHVEPGKFDIKVRYRIDGILHQMPTPPKRA